MSLMYLNQCKYALTSCIYATDRTVEIRNCPSDVTTQVNSLRRTATVTWQDPEFVDHLGRLIPFVCNVQNSREFLFGSHTVTCYPHMHPDVVCNFRVTVTGLYQRKDLSLFITFHSNNYCKILCVQCIIFIY